MSEEEYGVPSAKRESELYRVRFPDRLQNNSMLPFHATNKKKACISHGWQQEPIRKKLALDFFVKFICATPTVSFFHQLLYSFYIRHGPSETVSFN